MKTKNNRERNRCRKYMVLVEDHVNEPGVYTKYIYSGGEWKKLYKELRTLELKMKSPRFKAPEDVKGTTFYMCVDGGYWSLRID